MMKKKTWLRLIESCAFLVLLVLVLAGISRIVERKEGRRVFGAFLDEPQAYDVLFFGDSRFMNAMMPPEIWADYGIAGYNLSCYGNSMPSSYWTMMNALDYASPKLAVFAINGVGDEKKVTGSSSDLHTAFDFFPLTLTKYRAIEDLMYDPDFPDAVDDEGNRYQDIKWEYLFTIGKYHSRWSELTRDDLIVKKEKRKGGEFLVGVMPYGEYDIIDDDIYAEEYGNGFHYLRKAIEECQSRGIEVLLINLPEPLTINEQKHANTVSSIAEEYGVSFVDMARLDSVVDYEVDCYDEQPHLNASGTQKATAYLGSYIQAHYDLPDRRSDERYAHWASEHQAYVDEKAERIRSQDQLNTLLVLLHDDDFDVRMAIRPDAALYYDDLSILLMHNMAREHVLEGDEYSMWSNSLYPLEGFDTALWESVPYFLYKKGQDVCEYTGEDAERAAQEYFGADEEDDVLIEVIDARTGKMAAEFRF